MIGGTSSKDNDALEMIALGFKMMTTPGSFKDAAITNAQDFINNKLKRNYKTEASKAALKKSIFLKLLDGNIELKKFQTKEAYEKANKPYSGSTFFSDKEKNGMIADWSKDNFGLNLQDVKPGDPGYGLVLGLQREIDVIAGEYKANGKAPPPNIMDLAWGKVNADFGIIPQKGGVSVFGLFDIPFTGSDAKVVRKKGGSGQGTGSSIVLPSTTQRQITVDEFKVMIEKYKGQLSEEQIIMSLKDQNIDTSLVE